MDTPLTAPHSDGPRAPDVAVLKLGRAAELVRAMHVINEEIRVKGACRRSTYVANIVDNEAEELRYGYVVRDGWQLARSGGVAPLPNSPCRAAHEGIAEVFRGAG